MKKKYITIIVIVLVLIGAGATFGIIHDNNEVKAEQLEKQEHEEQIEIEKDNLKTAETAIDKAYETRSDKDIEAAKTAIDKLSDNQKEDKTKLNDKITKLNNFLKQIFDVETAITNATKSKSDADINSAQVLIDKETDEYLKNDKLSAQKRLDELKALITKEKERQRLEAETKEKATKAAQTSQTEQNEAIQQPQTDTATQQNQASNQEAYQGQPQQQYREPTYQSPAQPSPSQPTPSAPAGGGGNSLPGGPTQGGGSNGAGITDSPGGNDGVGEIEWEH